MKTHVPVVARLVSLLLVLALAFVGVLGTALPIQADGLKPIPTPTIPSGLLPQVKEMLQNRLQGGGNPIPLTVTLSGNPSAHTDQGVVITAQVHPRLDGFSQMIPVTVSFWTDWYDAYPVIKYGNLADDFVWGVGWGIPGSHTIHAKACVDWINMCTENTFQVFVYPAVQQTIRFMSTTFLCSQDECKIWLTTTRQREGWELPIIALVSFTGRLWPELVIIGGPSTPYVLSFDIGQATEARIIWSSVPSEYPSATTVYPYGTWPTPTPDLPTPVVTKVPITPYPTSQPVGSPTPKTTPTPAAIIINPPAAKP